MVLKWFKRSALLAIGGALLLSSKMVSAAPVDLLDSAGASTGWSLDMPAGQNASLTPLRVAGNQAFFTKTATFTNATDPIILSFSRTSDTAKQLVIGDEAITNSTGQAWTGYRMIISAGSVGGTPNFAFVSSTELGAGDFNLDPFTAFKLVNNNSELQLSGGTVDIGGVWKPGSATSTGLAVVTNNSASDHFTLKEIPIVGTVPPPVAIPLPTAAWAGLSTMLGLSFIGAGKRAYHKLF
jgi:hypothetical protein